MKFNVRAGVLALCVTLAASTVKDIDSTETENCQCEQIHGSICATHFGTPNWFGRFPNARGLDKSRSIGEFFDFYRLLNMDTYCSHTLYNLLCFHYFPQCFLDTHPQLGVTPCRETCNEALAACFPHARAYDPNYQFPEHLDCSNFPTGSSECNPAHAEGEDGDDCETPCIACPNATKHLEFASEPGLRALEGSELSGRVDICLRLACVGSYEPTATLEQEVVVNIHPTGRSAEPGVDFIAQDSTITFPVGAWKGDVLCTPIEILRDNLEEGPEIMIVEATITSPSSAIIGAALKSSVGTINVNIIDNYPPEVIPTPPTTTTESTTTETTSTQVPMQSPSPLPVPDPVIPATECKSSCGWRTRINRNTFRNNPYTFAAHVQVKACRASVLDVVIMNCEDIVCGVCPEPGPYKLAVCPNCFNGCPIEGEFIVSGSNSGGSLYISNYRKGGLWALHAAQWENNVPVCLES